MVSPLETRLLAALPQGLGRQNSHSPGNCPVVWPVGFRDSRKERRGCPETDPESMRPVQTANLGGARNTGTRGKVQQGEESR